MNWNLAKGLFFKWSLNQSLYRCKVFVQKKRDNWNSKKECFVSELNLWLLSLIFYFDVGSPTISYSSVPPTYTHPPSSVSIIHHIWRVSPQMTCLFALSHGATREGSYVTAGTFLGLWGWLLLRDIQRKSNNYVTYANPWTLAVSTGCWCFFLLWCRRSSPWEETNSTLHIRLTETGTWELSCGSNSSHLFFYLVPMVTIGMHFSQWQVGSWNPRRPWTRAYSIHSKVSFDLISCLLEPSSTNNGKIDLHIFTTQETEYNCILGSPKCPFFAHQM